MCGCLLLSLIVRRYVRIATVMKLDYLVIGHVTRDVTPAGNLVGGTAAYAGRVAQALGCHTAVLTRCQPEYKGLHDLADLTVEVVPSAHTTTFENSYGPDGRTQRIDTVADAIGPEHVPVDWTETAVVHLAPVANEVDPALVHSFPNSLIGLTPQGWARRAVAMFHAHGADRLVAEVNQGGEMVETLIRQVDPMVPFRAVRASQGKSARAEPVAALYEQGRVAHLPGLGALEEQMALMTAQGFKGTGSPDRVDALVWALHALILGPARSYRTPQVRVL